MWDRQLAYRVLGAEDLAPVVPNTLSEEEISDIDRLFEDERVHPSFIVVKLCNSLG